MRSLIYIERLFNRIGDVIDTFPAYVYPSCCERCKKDVPWWDTPFNDVFNIAFQEMERHLFSAVFLLGVPYAIKGWSRTSWWRFLRTTQLQGTSDGWPDRYRCLPASFRLLVASGLESMLRKKVITWRNAQRDPGGLPYRWIIKAMIPLSFFLMALSGVGFDPAPAE